MGVVSHVFFERKFTIYRARFYLLFESLFSERKFKCKAGVNENCLTNH